MESQATPVEPARLSDHELAMLESTLHVQLEVTKFVRVAQITGAVGVAVLSGGLSAIPSGYSIVTSQVQRSKCKRRHREVMGQMLERGLPRLVRDAKPLGRRAYSISVATGCVCCVLSIAADLLIDHAVLQVVSEVVLNLTDEFFMGTLKTHMTARLGTLKHSSSAMTTSPQGDEQHRQLKTSRSWAGLKSQWKDRKNKWTLTKKAESLPPDLFGERELLERGHEAVEESQVPQSVEIQRTSEFAAFGECLMLRFSTVVPGVDDSSEDLNSCRRYGRMTITGEDEALPEDHWTSLWKVEDEFVDDATVSEDGDYHDLFGGGDNHHARASVDSSDDEDDYVESFGASLKERETDYDLFGLNDAKRISPYSAFRHQERSIFDVPAISYRSSSGRGMCGGCAGY